MRRATYTGESGNSGYPGNPNGLGHLRLMASRPNAHIFPYAIRGFDKYGRSAAPPQPRSILSGWTMNFERAAGSAGNRTYLKDEVLRRFNGAISEDQLLRYLDEGVGWYKWRTMEPGYGPSTQAQVQVALDEINERTLKRIGELYQAQRVTTAHWLRTMHRPLGTDSGIPRYDNDYDRTIEFKLN